MEYFNRTESVTYQLVRTEVSDPNLNNNEPHDSRKKWFLEINDIAEKFKQLELWDHRASLHKDHTRPTEFHVKDVYFVSGMDNGGNEDEGQKEREVGAKVREGIPFILTVR